MDDYKIKIDNNKQYARNHIDEKKKLDFHGGCSNCVTPLHYGLGNCLGCLYFHGVTSDYPELKIQDIKTVKYLKYTNNERIGTSCKKCKQVVCMCDIYFKDKYRIGKKNHCAILYAETGQEYLVFPRGEENHVEEFCKWLNENKK